MVTTRAIASGTSIFPLAQAGTAQPRSAPAANPLVTRVASLLAGDLSRTEEQEILDTLGRVPAADLNAILTGVNVETLLDKVENHWFGSGRHHHDELMALLSRRATELSVPNRCAVITALQKGWTDAADERLIRDMIVATTGSDLSRLKRMIDLGGESHDLLNLMNDDVDDSTIRAQIRAHIAAQGATPTGQVKVYSDVDDTFYSNWVDDRFPKKAIYPGVRAFYRELDLGRNGNDTTGDLAFLSARIGLQENGTLAMMRGYGIDQATMLEGDITHAIGNSNIAAKKVENYFAHRALYPEYGSVFIGDSGQGDAIAGAEMVRREPQGTKAVFIHNVTHMDQATRASWTAKGVFVFDSYVDAAIEAYKRGLISRAGVDRIAAAARRELDAMTNLSAQQRTNADAVLRAAESRVAALP